MRTDGMDALRVALRAFGDEIITTAHLGDILGLKTESERQVLRRRLGQLIKTGEAEKVAYGQFRYFSDRAPSRHGESFQKIWRIVRIQPPGWSKVTIASLSRVSRSVVDRYLSHLEDEGYVDRCGRNGNSVLWRTTIKGKERRETPYPPIESRDPYEQERAATAQLCQIMLTRDLNQRSTRSRIRNSLAILMQRFCTQDENQDDTQKTEGEVHV